MWNKVLMLSVITVVLCSGKGLEAKPQPTPYQDKLRMLRSTQTKLMQLEAIRIQLLRKFKPTSPQVRRIDKQRAELRRRLATLRRQLPHPYPYGPYPYRPFPYHPFPYYTPPEFELLSKGTA